MKKRKTGEKGGNLFTEIDLILLKELSTAKNNYSVLELKDKLNLAHMSTRRHLNHLEAMKLVSRERIPKTNRAALKLTNDGRVVLNLFTRLIKNKKKE